MWNKTYTLWQYYVFQGTTKLANHKPSSLSRRKCGEEKRENRARARNKGPRNWRASASQLFYFPSGAYQYQGSICHAFGTRNPHDVYKLDDGSHVSTPW